MKKNSIYFLITIIFLFCINLFAEENLSFASLGSKEDQRWSATLHLQSGEKIAYNYVAVETYSAIRVRKISDGKDFTVSWGNVKYIAFDQAGREENFSEDKKCYLTETGLDGAERWSATLNLQSGETVTYSTVIVEGPVAIRVRNSSTGKDFTAPWGNIKFITFAQSGRSYNQAAEENKPSLLAPDSAEGQRWSATLYLQTGEKIAYNSVIVEGGSAIRVRKTDGKDFTTPWWNLKYIIFDQAGRKQVQIENTNLKNLAAISSDDTQNQRWTATMHLQTGESITYNMVVFDNGNAIRVRKTDGKDFTTTWGNIKFIFF